MRCRRSPTWWTTRISMTRCSPCAPIIVRLSLPRAALSPDPTDEASEALLCRAESMARKVLGVQATEDLPHIAAWREAFRAFGAKPQRTRNSVEALTRRVQTGLPRVNRLTDIYNAVSVIHQLPIGGEDLSRLRRAAQAHSGDRSGDLRYDRRRNRRRGASRRR